MFNEESNSLRLGVVLGQVFYTIVNYMYQVHVFACIMISPIRFRTDAIRCFFWKNIAFHLGPSRSRLKASSQHCLIISVY